MKRGISRERPAPVGEAATGTPFGMQSAYSCAFRPSKVPACCPSLTGSWALLPSTTWLQGKLITVYVIITIMLVVVMMRTRWLSSGSSWVHAVAVVCLKASLSCCEASCCQTMTNMICCHLLRSISSLHCADMVVSPFPKLLQLTVSLHNPVACWQAFAASIVAAHMAVWCLPSNCQVGQSP